MCCWMARVGLRPPEVLGPRHGGAREQVEAGAEPPARAGEHDDPHGPVVDELVEGDVQVGDQLVAHGVEPVGPVQGEEGDPGSGLGSERRCQASAVIFASATGGRLDCPTPMEELNIGLLLEAVAAAVPDREAIVQRGGRRFTYARAPSTGAGGSPPCSPRPGSARHGADRLEPWEAGQDLALLYMTNCPEYLEGMLGSYLARVGPANVNYRYTAEEIAYLVADSGARAAVVHARFAPTLLEAARAGRAHLRPAARRRRRQRHTAARRRRRLRGGAGRGRPGRALPEPSPDDLYVVYTGGTTGMPKGVLWRQTDFLAGALGVTGTYDGLAAAAAKPHRRAAAHASPLRR